MHGLRTPFEIRPATFLLFVLAALVLVTISGCDSGKPVVTLYCAQDQVYAEPLLEQFTKETGIRVKTVFDNEAAKTVGLAQRLRAEAANPQCDVFWGNEELRTRQLATLGIWRETNGWAAFGFRSRRLVVNTNLISAGKIPARIEELTNAVWRGKLALAYPLFGSTSTHFIALRQRWGEARWQAWCRALAANKPFLVDGNSAVVKLVGRGDAPIGFTDSDDIVAGQREGLPVASAALTDEFLILPNTVAVTRKAPHPREAEKLFRWLQKRPVTDALLQAGAIEGTHPGLRPHLKPLWDSVVKDVEPATEAMKGIFLR